MPSPSPHQCHFGQSPKLTLENAGHYFGIDPVPSHSSVTMVDLFLGAAIENRRQDYAYAQPAEAHFHPYPYPVPPMMSRSQAICLVCRNALLHEMDRSFGVDHIVVMNHNPAAMMANHHPSGIDIAVMPSSLADPHSDLSSHSCSATATCKWTRHDNPEACGAQITCRTVSAHFARAHGIRKLGREVLLCCQWEGCYSLIKRESFVRHVREHHLGHSR